MSFLYKNFKVRSKDRNKTDPALSHQHNGQKREFVT